MKIRNKGLIICLSLIVFLFGYTQVSAKSVIANCYYYPKQADPDTIKNMEDYNEDGAIDANDYDLYIEGFKEQCDTPELKDIQETVVNIIYFLWVLGIPVFGVAGMYIGFQYMTSGGEADALSELKKRGLYLGAGLVVFVGTHPLAAGAMKLIINSETSCYAGLAQPGFRVFFPNVCSDDAVYTLNSCSDIPDPSAACRQACVLYKNQLNSSCNTGGVDNDVCLKTFTNYAFRQEEKLFLVNSLSCLCTKGTPPTACSEVKSAPGMEVFTP